MPPSPSSPLPPHQRHKRLSPAHLLNGPSFPLTPHRHNSTHLSHLVILFSRHRGPSLSRLQSLALDRFHHEPIYNLLSPTESVERILTAYAQLLNEFFFFGCLKDRVVLCFGKIDGKGVDIGSGGCCVEIGRKVEKKRKETEEKKKLLGTVKKNKQKEYENLNSAKKGEGHEKDAKTAEYSNRCEITLFTIHDSKVPVSTDKLHSYITTLAHHLIHAFLRIYSCASPSCRQTWEHCGRTGHSAAWQDIAYVIEKAMNDKTLLNLNVDLRRESALALELVVSGEKEGVVVGEQEIRAWKMDGEVLQREFRRLDGELRGGRKKLVRGEEI